MTSRDRAGVPVFGAVPQYPLESVDNALKVIYLLGNRAEVRLFEIAEILGVASSTAHRLLATLQYRGFAMQNVHTKTYNAGPALSQISYSILQRFDVRTELRPLLHELQETFQETVHLSVREGTSVRYIDALESPRPVRVVGRIGRLLPATSSSSGKALLAQLDEVDLRNLYPQSTLETVNDRSVRTRSELEAELQLTRERGYALSIEESEEGVTSIATTLPEAITPMRFAVSLSIPTGRLDQNEIDTIGKKIQQIVSTLLLNS